MHRQKAILAIALGVFALASPDNVQAQLYLTSSPSVDYYVNRTHGQDTLRVGLRATVMQELNRGAGTQVTPEFLNSGSAPRRSAASKPFAGASRGPTVSPYLNLVRDDLVDVNTVNYYSLVQPQMQAQRFAQQQQRQNQLINRQLQQIQAQSGFTPQGSQVMNPTGHVTTFQFYGNFYPMLSRRR